MSPSRGASTADVSPLPSLYEYDNGHVAMESDMLATSNHSWTERSQGHRRQVSSMSVQSEAGLLADVNKPLPQLPTGEMQSRKHVRGWRFGVRVAAWTTFAILTLNVLVCIIAASKFGASSGIGTAYDGSCKTVDGYATWIHVLINIFSSLLLAASNYSMQCLAAPTRQECDRAHASGDYLDVGVFSMRNIFRLKRSRIVLWTILAISSIPIHVVYNATIIKTLSTYDYKGLVVNRAFLEGTSGISFAFSTASSSTLAITPPLIPTFFSLQQSYIENRASYTNLTMEECFNAYASDYVNQNNNFLIVANDTQTAGVVYSPLIIPSAPPKQPYSWICRDPRDNDYEDMTGATCTVQGLHMDTYQMFGVTPLYCLTQIMPEHCQLQFSVAAVVIVIICNVMKVAIMFTLLRRFKTTPTMVVVGDAIASYLDRPDTTTAHGRVLDRKEAIHKAKQLKSHNLNLSAITEEGVCIPDGIEPRRWGFAATRWQWFTFCATGFVGVSLAVTGSALASAFSTSGDDGDPGYREIGNISPQNVVSVFSDNDEALTLTKLIFLANAPQLILSCVYLIFNGLLTVMLLSHEWSSYAVKKQTLRVTTPEGKQRSSYWLHIPFVYSVPTIATFVVLHWLLSESLYVVRIQTIYDHTFYTADFESSAGSYSNNDNGPNTMNTTEVVAPSVVFYASNVSASSSFSANTSPDSMLGFSWLALFCVTWVSFAMFTLLVFIAFFRRFKSAMPVAASNSLAIASACHRPADDDKASLLAVQWGEVSSSVATGPHYTFTSLEVKEVVPGKGRRRPLNAWGHFIFKIRSHGNSKGKHHKLHDVAEGIQLQERSYTAAG